MSTLPPGSDLGETQPDLANRQPEHGLPKSFGLSVAGFVVATSMPVVFLIGILIGSVSYVVCEDNADTLDELFACGDLERLVAALTVLAVSVVSVLISSVGWRRAINIRRKHTGLKTGLGFAIAGFCQGAFWTLFSLTGVLSYASQGG